MNNSVSELEIGLCQETVKEGFFHLQFHHSAGNKMQGLVGERKVFTCTFMIEMVTKFQGLTSNSNSTQDLRGEKNCIHFQ
jgi:hypothetical protein